MKRRVDRIIVHCSATRPEWMEDLDGIDRVEEIRRWHIESRGWSDIGYHLIIDRNGEVLPGRDMERTGAHTIGHNKGTIGICLIGGHGSSSSDDFFDHFTLEQNHALHSVIATLKAATGDALPVHGHNEFAAKACPGFQVKHWLMQPYPPKKEAA